MSRVETRRDETSRGEPSETSRVEARRAKRSAVRRAKCMQLLSSRKMPVTVTARVLHMRRAGASYHANARPAAEAGGVGVVLGCGMVSCRSLGRQQARAG
jgi:hypothetical protein